MRINYYLCLINFKEKLYRQRHYYKSIRYGMFNIFWDVLNMVSRGMLERCWVL